MTGARDLGPIPPEVNVPALAYALGPAATILEKLTARQRLFCEEYLKDMNATQAAIRAGYSEKTAGQIGYENLRKTDIVDALSAIMAKRSERTGIDRSWVLTQLADVHEKASAKDTAADRGNRLKALELIGRHVDVRAFRVGFGFAPNDEGSGPLPEWDLSRLKDEEFDEFERLLSKISVLGPNAGGAGSEAAAQASGAPQEAQGADSGGV